MRTYKTVAGSAHHLLFGGEELQRCHQGQTAIPYLNSTIMTKEEESPISQNAAANENI
jgi:hypothetical protein